MQELYNKIFFKIQDLLIYELGNKNHFKNINDQNFSRFMRGVTTKGSYDKGFYGIPIYLRISLLNSIVDLNSWSCNFN